MSRTERDRLYWDQGIVLVPTMTGAVTVMDCSDLKEACHHLEVPLPMSGTVLDIGCGTGRWSEYCEMYQGVDISRDAVRYCRRRNLQAELIDGPDDLPMTRTGFPFSWITCFSVFTHINLAARTAYLNEFRYRTSQVLVDIIPGDGRGNVSLWTADPVEFQSSVAGARFRIKAVWERTSPDGVQHRYYRLEGE